MAEEKAMFEGQSLKKVICNSEMVKQEIITNFDIDENKVTVIYNGVDTTRFKPANQDIKTTLRQTLNIPKDALVFIFSGSGFERKNLSTTLKAFSQLNETCYLMVVGRDKKSAYYKKLAIKLDCEDRVIFLGAQDRKKMPTIYQTADVLVLPTLYDPFPNVILEGFASGLPCITSSSCGAVDVIPAHHCGQIIEATDTEALSVAMSSYQDKKRLTTEANNAAHLAKQFTVETMQQKLLQLYIDVLETNNV